MTRDEALELLGFVTGEPVNVRTVRAAWARKVRVTHPDTAEEIKGEIASNLMRFNAARDLLLTSVENEACKSCKGRGMVRAGRWGWRKCSACEGSGDKQ